MARKHRDRLDQAIDAYRSGFESQRLSERARATIFQEISSGESRPAHQGNVFFPLRRWLLAGAVPFLLVLVAVAWWGSRSAPVATATNVQVAKIGDRVVFTMANGGTPHTVTKSAVPDRFDRSGAATVTRGSFADRLDSGPDLVFYKID